MKRAAVQHDSYSLSFGPSSGIREVCTAREVLLVDDEELVLRALSVGLERAGFELTVQSDPLRALELVRENPRRFGVVVTDLQMPGMSGLELALRVREVSPTIGIVLHAGTLAPGATVREVDAVIRKPCTVAQLSSQLTLLLDQP